MTSNLPEAYLAEYSEPAGYLDFASVSPVARRVATAVAAALWSVHSPDASPLEEVMGGYGEAAATVAGRLGVAADDVAFPPGTSAGLFQVAFGLPTGNIVVPRHEFPANVYPWLRASSRGGPEVRFVEIPDGRVTAAALRPAVDDETVAIAVSQVDFHFGYRADLGELRSLAGEALVVVDAVQGLGALSVDTAAADVVAAGGQKWLRAGFGCGLLYVSPRARDRLAPDLVGWYGVEDMFDMELAVPHRPRTGTERFMVGSPPVFGALAVAAAVAAASEAPAEMVERRVLDLSERMEEAVLRRGGQLACPGLGRGERSGIVSFRLDGEPTEITAQRLAAAGIVCTHRNGWIRLSAHGSTTDATIEMLDIALVR